MSSLVFVLAMILLYFKLKNGKTDTAIESDDKISERTDGVTRLGESLTARDKDSLVEAPSFDGVRHLLDILTKQYKQRFDASRTEVSIIGDKTYYQIGDVVKIRITLYDSYGMMRPTGGDQIKVRIFEDALNASASGHVIDHENGSYTAVVKCLWSGTPSIQIHMGNIRECINLTETVISQLPAIRDTYVVYKNGEKLKCHPFKTRLTEGHPDSRVCDMTELNGGMSWYCYPPDSKELSCGDFKHFGYGSMNIYYMLERTFASLVSQAALKPTLKVKVEASDLGDVTPPSTTPCNVFNRDHLWALQSPIGYFFRNRWILLHCTPQSHRTFKPCLRDKHLVLYGDSTVRLWFVEFKERFECSLTSEPWTDPKWKRDSTAYCPSNNLTIDLVFHALPGLIDNVKVKYNSISRHILNLPRLKSTVILIYLENHFDSYHLDVFLDRLSHIRKSVQIILERDPNIKVLIKGGHRSRTVFDYRRVLIRRIVTNYFAGMHDTIVYLDNMDITVARSTEPTHPPSHIVRTMVDQMLGYIC